MKINDAKKVLDMLPATTDGVGVTLVSKEDVIHLLDMIDDCTVYPNQPFIPDYPLQQPMTSPNWPPTFPQVWYSNGPKDAYRNPVPYCISCSTTLGDPEGPCHRGSCNATSTAKKN